MNTTHDNWTTAPDYNNAMCDYCGKKATHDAKTNTGHWAFVCADHFASETEGKLGTGFAQELIAITNFCTTTNDRGITFELRLINTGDRYGRNNCLINDQAPMIEFWDTRYHQFVSRYYLSTLLKFDRWSLSQRPLDETGLCLDGGIPDWSINAAAMRAPLQWMKQLATTLGITPESAA